MEEPVTDNQQAPVAAPASMPSKRRGWLRDWRFWLTIGLVVFVGAAVGCWLVVDAAENRRLDLESVTLAEDLTAEFGKKVHVSDFLANLDGELVEDFEIDTNALGSVAINFEYINIRGRKRPANFTLEVVDRTAPAIYGRSAYTVPIDYAGDLTDLMMSGDDLDDYPKREIRGEYDLTTAGDYALEYVITDASGNQNRKVFTLTVKKPATSSGGNSSGDDLPKLPLADVIKTYKNDCTWVGIDVSAWQGEIDWQKVKDARVEFAFVRLGYQDGYGGEYMLDRTFLDNIKGAEGVGLPVGVYFYSYANSLEQAKRQAEWAMEQVQGFSVELGIAFDWENWSDFNAAGMSFWTINQVARTFIKTVEEQNYRGWLYGSKNYLETVWQPKELDIWLAQYFDFPTYTGNFWVWQMSSSGRVPGINGDVDLDIMYLDVKHDTSE